MLLSQARTRPLVIGQGGIPAVELKCRGPFWNKESTQGSRKQHRCCESPDQRSELTFGEADQEKQSPRVWGPACLRRVTETSL